MFMRSITSTGLLAGAVLLAAAGCAPNYRYTPTADSGNLSIAMAEKQCKFETDKVVAADASGFAVYRVSELTKSCMEAKGFLAEQTSGGP
jgi:hypothetical protein